MPPVLAFPVGHAFLHSHTPFPWQSGWEENVCPHTNVTQSTREWRVGMEAQSLLLAQPVEGEGGRADPSLP